ncbi:MAG: type II secretion system secretin GspD [Dokdonella sp.]|uniref:type II secretion system secretin GspD n=1 Tax=Dokdonella sp. TaxID=2291710 RepID=UPI003263FDCB
MRSRLTTLLMAFGIALLSGCATNVPKDSNGPESQILTADTILKPAPPIEPTDGASGISVSPNATANRPPPKPEYNLGTGKFFTKQADARGGGKGEGQVTFNFENQPVQAVVKAILGDMLGENYTIAPNVAGNVTYSTSRPIRREDAMSVLEMLLSWTNNALVHEGNRYTVLASKDAIPGKLTPHVGATQQPGYALRIFPLQYISASEMAKLLKPYAKADAFVSIDPDRSLLVLAGNQSELDNYQKTIATFDVDWLRGMSIGVFTLQHVEVTKLLPDLEKIFGSKGESPLAGMFRFMPIEQTNAIIAITPQPEYLKQAQEWLLRLDRGGAENATQLYIYNVKNLKSADLADYLSEIFLGTQAGSRRSSTSGSVGQGLRSTTLGRSGGGGGFGGGSSSLNYGSSLRPQAAQEKSAPASTPSTAASGTAGANGKKETDIRISAIEENNQLMIMAQPYEWDQIQSAIRKLDTVPLQVQIEARILEVSLTGGLQYGVQWWLGNQQTQEAGGQYDSTRGPYRYPNPYDRFGSTVGKTGPGAAGSIFYSFLNSKFQVQLSALETSGQAKTLSAPSLVVNNNQEASLSVGDQIPINQTSLVGIGGTVNGNGTTAQTGYSSVQYLSTGVTLQVKPRVNPGGLVYLDISQEVSTPGPIPASGNPQIAQRQIETQVAVQSGQTLLLGGLIKEISNTGKTSVPLLSKVPLLRDLFGQTQTSKDRTELIVLITPRVINNSDEAAQMTLDYSRQFESLAPLREKGQPISNPPTPTPPSPPVETRPLPQDPNSQEDLLRDH